MEAIGSFLNPCNCIESIIADSFGCFDCSTEQKIGMVVVAIFAAIAFFFVLESALQYIAAAVAAGALLFAIRWIFCSNSDHATGVRSGISNFFSTIGASVEKAGDDFTDGMGNFELAVISAESRLGGLGNGPHSRPPLVPPRRASPDAGFSGGLFGGRTPTVSSPSVFHHASPSGFPQQNHAEVGGADRPPHTPGAPTFGRGDPFGGRNRANVGGAHRQPHMPGGPNPSDGGFLDSLGGLFGGEAAHSQVGGRPGGRMPGMPPSTFLGGF